MPQPLKGGGDPLDGVAGIIEVEGVFKGVVAFMGRENLDVSPGETDPSTLPGPGRSGSKRGGSHTRRSCLSRPVSRSSGAAGTNTNHRAAITRRAQAEKTPGR